MVHLPRSVSRFAGRYPGVRQRLGLLALAASLLPAVVSAAVGRVAGQGTVDAGGGATWSIPFTVAAGVNGLAPELGLAWRSQAGDGPAGHGVEITGVSRIARCPRLIATDGATRGVQFDDGDRFCLDGRILVLVAGQYGADGAEYRTEQDRLERIWSRGRYGTGPASFEVRQTDGLTRFYGATVDARIPAPGVAGATREWAHSSTRDLYGYQITVRYLGDPELGEAWPAEVLWTVDSNGAGARFRLGFDYTGRPASAVRRGFVWDSTWLRSRQLIRVRYDSDEGAGFVPLHRYELAYEGGSSGRQRLRSVTQCAGSDCLPATTFSWDNGSPVFAASVTGPSDAPPPDLVFTDIDGDQAADLLMPTGVAPNTFWSLRRTDPASAALIGSTRTGTAIAWQGSAIPLDYTGDGRRDLLTVDRSTTQASWVARRSTGTGYGAPVPTGLGHPAVLSVTPLDLDSDGRDDLVYPCGTRLCYRLSTGTAFGPERATSVTYGSGDQLYKATIGTQPPVDFDGDGRADLLLRRQNGLLIAEAVYEGYRATGNDLVRVFTTSRATDAQPLDVNGDGLTDLAVRDTASGQWLLHLSRGRTLAPAVPAGLAAGIEGLLVTDWNGDGRDDVVRAVGTAGWRVYLADDGADTPFSTTDPNRYEALADLRPPSEASLFVVDLTGDGQAELLQYNGLDQRWEARRRTSGRPDLLTAAVDGLGNRWAPTLTPLAGFAGYGVDAADGPEDRVLRGGPLTVVSTVTESDGAGGSYTTRYSYRNGRVSRMGRGFLGFATVRSTDSRYPALHGMELATETTYRQDFPFIGAAERIVLARGDGLRYSDRDPGWASSVQPAPLDPAADTHFVYPTGDTSEQFETDAAGGLAGSLVRRVVRTLAWDIPHGAVQRETVTTTSPDDPDTHVSTTVRSFDDSSRAARGCLGLVTREDVTESHGGSSLTRSSASTWVASSCRRQTVTTGLEAPPDQQLVTTYGYTGAGQPGLVSQRSADGSAARSQVTVVFVRGTNRPATSTTSWLSQPAHVTSHRWHQGLDVEIERTDPRGLVSRWQRDGFGRLTREQQADAAGGGSTVQYLGCDSACFAPASSYQVFSRRDDGFWSRTLHDSLGREVGREQPLPAGGSSRQVTRYDALGRMARQSVPQTGSGEPAYWVEQGYEPGGRLRSQERPAGNGQAGGARSRYSYARLASTTIDAENRSTVRHTDARGRLVRVVAADGGVARYTWTPFGEVASITDAVGTTTRLAYDPRGRVASVQSPDSGTRTTRYNALGDLASEAGTAGAASSITYSYDPLGRLWSRSDSAGTATWEYGVTAGPAFGQLIRVSQPAGAGNAAFSESYAYDSGGRRSQVSTSIDGTVYVTDFGWDNLGRATGAVYPVTVNGNRPRFRYRYDASGFIAGVDQDLSGGGGLWVPLYGILAADAVGRPAHVRLGNTDTIDSRWLRDPGTLQLTGIRTGPALDSSRQNLDYRWDRVGNLLQRADRNAGLTEDFGFDPVDRLTSAARNGVATLSVTWDSGGRIRSRSDVGSYSYTAERPSAVAAVSGGPRGNLAYAYDGNGNMVSRQGHPITWTAFNQPLSISYGSAGRAEFGYGPARQRVRQVSWTGRLQRTTHYVGPHFEVEMEGSNRRYRSTVYANGEAFYSQVEQLAPATVEGYFLHRDHLGSIDTLSRVIGSGSDVAKLSFDAFGKRRNTDWTADSTDTRYQDRHFTERGFTGHEHLDNVRLVHMNGRVQDPLLGLMLSPDPVLGNLAEPETLNRYAYVAGNGVSATDPSGFFLRRLVKNIGRAFRSAFSFVKRFVREYGREIVAAIAAYYTGGAVSDWYIGQVGYSATNLVSAGVLGGMAGGAVSGAIASGDPRGIIGGAVSGGIMRGIDFNFGPVWTVKRVVVTSVAAGAINFVERGSFVQGLGAGAVTGGARLAYNRYVGYESSWDSGGEATPKDRFALPVAGANNFGEARPVIDPDDFAGEGGRVSRIMNRVPGMNAIAGVHDVMQVGWDRLGGRGLRGALNYPGMPVAALATYPALVDVTSAMAGDAR